MYIVFVTTEIDPILPGGAGTVVAELSRRLTAAGHRVEILVIATAPEGVANLDLPVTWVAPGVPDWDAPDQHRANARAAALAVSGLADRPDLVEFQDFQGLGLWALMRRGELGLAGTPLTVRAHGPIGLVWQDAAPDHDPLTRTIEREAFQMADAVVVPSPALAEVLTEHYQLEPDRVRIGEPPVPEVSAVERRPADAPEIVSYGRLGGQKGSEELLRAALPLLEADRRALLRFVGHDGWRIDTGGSMAAHLQTLIPDHVVDQVRFEEPIARGQLGEVMASAWIAVFPSRFETFALAVHECRRLGVPIVIPQIPAYRDYFGYRTGARVYDGTVAGLEEAIAELIADPGMRASLAAAPAPAYGDPLLAYQPLAARHPRTQAGLATAALRRVEAVANPQPAAAPAHVGDRILDGLPEAVAGRLEQHAPEIPVIGRWRRRRAATGWERELMAAAWEGGYPVLDHPEVSIVIPCFNQGEFLHSAIRSVLRQAFDSWEIIIVDDGSTDPHTRAVLRSLHYPRTRILRQRNLGLSAARNAGMQAARGRYLVPLDADDELTPAFLSATVEALQANPSAAFAHTWTRLFGNQNLVWVDRPYNPYQLLLSTSVVGCALIRADAWTRVGGYDTNRRQGNEDWDLWIRLLEHGWGQVEVPHPLFRYRQHGISMSVTTEARFEDARIEMAESHPALYEPEALRALKAEWYPWVSVIVDATADLATLASQTLDDLEIVVPGDAGPAIEELTRERGWPRRSVGPALGAAIHGARGKFVIDWRPVIQAGPDLLNELATLLEDDDEAYASAVESGRHPTLWRRWSLLDPAADPHRLAKAGTRGSGPVLDESDFLGAFPHDRWAIDPAGFAFPLQRVRPEADGRFPDWLP